MKNLLKIFILLIVIFPSAASGQEMRLLVPERVKSGESFEVSVELDTGGVLINSASLTLGYDDSIFSFAGYKSDDSIIQLWVDPPRAQGGKISLSGIIPGGVAGEFDPQKTAVQDITLVKLIFKAVSEGEAKFSFMESSVLKHDGRGSEFAHTTENSTVLVAGVAEGGLAADTVAPRAFTLTFLDAGFFSRTPSMIIWNTNDSESGIKEYKIKVGWGSWKTGESPYRVARGVFPKLVSVRAYDYSDNWSAASVTIHGLVSWRVMAGIVIVILLCLVRFKMIK